MKNFINIVWDNKALSEVDEYLVDTVLECADEALVEDETNYETYDTIAVSYTHLTLPTKRIV